MNISRACDYNIEQFWLDFKKSMTNFYMENNKSRPINYWSNKLNELQANKQYNLIELHIRDYMSLYAIDLLRTCSLYHTGILITNIKRWNALAANNSKFEIHSENNGPYINIIFLLLDIFNTITNKCISNNEEIINIFSMVELFIIHEDLTVFVDYSLKHNKPSIIDKINQFEAHNDNNNTINYIQNKYNIQLSPKISSKKIFNKIPKNEN